MVGLGRQSYLKLLRENNELKLKQTNDGRRIQELLSAGESYEDEMVMCKDVRPEISNKFIVNDVLPLTFSSISTSTRLRPGRNARKTLPPVSRILEARCEPPRTQ